LQNTYIHYNIQKYSLQSTIIYLQLFRRTCFNQLKYFIIHIIYKNGYTSQKEAENKIFLENLLLIKFMNALLSRDWKTRSQMTHIKNGIFMVYPARGLVLVPLQKMYEKKLRNSFKMSDLKKFWLSFCPTSLILKIYASFVSDSINKFTIKTHLLNYMFFLLSQNLIEQFSIKSQFSLLTAMHLSTSRLPNTDYCSALSHPRYL